MKRALIIGASAGLTFAGIAYIVVKLLGYTSTSLMVLLYLYVVLALIKSIYFGAGIHRSGLRSFLDRIVVVVEGEELKIRRLLSGEKYKVKGELEKL